jgi:Glycosyltransferase family 87
MLNRPQLVVAVSCVAAVGMWLYVLCVLIPHQRRDALVTQTPRGNLSDLYPRWLGARELLLRGRDPYGSEITREIQGGYYGRELDPVRPNDPKDQQAFAYPVYVVLMLAPTVRMEFATVQRIFFWFLALLTAASVLLWLDALGYRIPAWGKAAWIVFTLGWFPAIQGIKLQQLSLLVAALIAAALSAVTRRQFVLGGVMLALATIKPQLVFLLFLWLLVWIAGNWRDRQRLLWSFVITFAVLLLAGEMLLPGWVREFREALSEYYRYTGGGKSVLDVLLTPIWGRLAAGILVALLVIFVWHLQRAGERTDQFRWSLCFTLAATLLVIPMSAPYNQLLLLPGLMMIVGSGRGLLQRNRLLRFLVGLTTVALFWPFVVAAALVIALLFLAGTTVQRAWGVPFYPTFAIPITIYAVLLAGRKTLIERDGERP